VLSRVLLKKICVQLRTQYVVMIMKPLQEVVSELEMDQEDSTLAKRDLSRRFKLIQEQKAATSTDDFEYVKICNFSFLEWVLRVAKL